MLLPRVHQCPLDDRHSLFPPHSGKATILPTIPAANLNHKKTSVHFDTWHRKGIELMWGFNTPSHPVPRSSAVVYLCIPTAPLRAAGCGTVMQYPQGKSGSAVDVNGVEAPGSFLSEVVSILCREECCN